MAVGKASVADRTSLIVWRTILDNELFTTTPDKGVVFTNAVDIDAIATTDAVLLAALVGAATVFTAGIDQALILAEARLIHAIEPQLSAVETRYGTIQTFGNGVADTETFFCDRIATACGFVRFVAVMRAQKSVIFADFIGCPTVLTVEIAVQAIGQDIVFTFAHITDSATVVDDTCINA